MNTLRRHGFTLLELVISCAILVTIFALAATALTRVHRLRADSEAQTRLMTEGRALLDDLAAQFAHVAGTNIWISESNASDSNEKLTLALIRYAVHPQSRQKGDAYADAPYYSMRLDFTSGSSLNSTSTVESIAHSSVTDGQLLHSNVNQVVYDTVKHGSSSVTNAYSAEEMGTHIPGAAAGDTISVPVTYGSSATTYGTRTSHDAHVVVVPSPFEGTNTVIADVSFENAHSGELSLTIRKPMAGRWPEPSSRTLRIDATAETSAENLATNSFMAPGYLDYTNVPVSSVTFPIDETNATARTSLMASVAAYDSLPPAYTNTNDVPVSVTNDVQEAVSNNVPASVSNDVPASVSNDVPASVSNNVPASVSNNVPASVSNNVPASVSNNVPASVTNDVPEAVTNDIPYLDAPYVSSANGLVTGELLFGPYDAPCIVSNYWTWGETTAVDTNGVISGISLVINGRTNTFASATDLAASSTSTVTHADADFQFSEIIDLLSVDLDEGGGLLGSFSNLFSIAPPVAFTNEFVPSDDAGSQLPVFVSEVLSYEERLSPQILATGFAVQSATAGAGTNATPLVLQTYKREMDLVIAKEFSTNDMVLRVDHDWHTYTSYRFVFDVDASLVPTNSWHYGGATTNVYPNGTSYDSETRWVDIVLDEDLEGADERTTGIWLREDDKRDLTELVVKTNTVKVPYSSPRDANSGVSEKPLAPAIWDSIQKVVITPLCFSTNENQRLDLMVWEPEDNPPGPPVCADIYLELLAPAHQRRAKKIPEGDLRDRYIQNHVIRLSRRAPIGTARKELP
jgi:type II secretory pathway pseudopilin PulG